MNTPYLNRYRNGEYLQYMTDVINLVNKQDPTTLQLDTPLDELKPIVDKIDQIFKLSQGSGLTQQLISLDDQRDGAIVGLRSITNGFTYHYDTTKSSAARALLSNMTSHGDNIQRLSYQEETAVINSIIKDWQTDQELIAAVTELSIEDWVAQLKQVNQDFSAKYLDRVDQAAANPAIEIPNLRTQATEAYRKLVTHIQAHATLSATKAYTSLVNQVDVLAGQYNQVVENRSNTDDQGDTDS